MQQSLNQAERVRREVEQLARAAQQRGQGQPGNQQGQQAGEQQGQGQQGQGQQGQQAGMGARGAAGPNGGGSGVNDGPRNGVIGGPLGGAWDGNGAWNASNFGGVWDGTPPPANPQAAYNDLIRDIARLRSSAIDDKDLSREFQDLMRRAQELDPQHWNNNPQLGAVIGQQVLSEVDQVELVLRRKLAATDGSVRSASPGNTPPGYANAVAEYNKRLSRQ